MKLLLLNAFSTSKKSETVLESNIISDSKVQSEEMQGSGQVYLRKK